MVLDLDGLVPADAGRSNPWHKNRTAALLNDLICRHVAEILDLPVSAVRVEKDRLGAPFLQGYQNLHLSKSYCARYAVCAFSSDRVGIDAEPVHLPNHAIARRYYAPAEIRQVFGSGTPSQEADWQVGKDPDRCRLWTALWTQKEAYGKFLGTGLSGLDHPELPTASVCAMNQIKLTEISLDSQTVCTVASRFSDLTVIRFSAKLLLDQAQQNF